MRQAWLEEPYKVVLRDVPQQPLADHQFRINVGQVSICASDVDKWFGRGLDKPNPLGHEFGGTVVEMGRWALEHSPIRPGDFVVPWTPDGHGLADEYVGDIRHAIQVPRPSRRDYPTIIEPMGCVVNSIKLAQIQVGDDVLIVGATGLMGLLAVQFARKSGARSVIATGRRPDGLGRALDHGATHVINTDVEDVSDVLERLGIAGVDVALDATGVKDGVAIATKAVRMSGTLGMVGFPQGEPLETPWEQICGKGLRMAICHFRPQEECVAGMQRAARLIESEWLTPGPLATHRFPFSTEGIEAAFRTAAAKPEGFVKSVIDYDLDNDVV